MIELADNTAASEREGGGGEGDAVYTRRESQ